MLNIIYDEKIFGDSEIIRIDFLRQNIFLYFKTTFRKDYILTIFDGIFISVECDGYPIVDYIESNDDNLTIFLIGGGYFKFRFTNIEVKEM